MPVKLALIVLGNLRVTAALPLTLTAVPVFIPSLSEILILRAVPQLAVVILAEPSNEVPLIVLAVANLVEVEAFPSKAPTICPFSKNLICAVVLLLYVALAWSVSVQYENNKSSV
ncbi:MAG: hypothetical protein IKR04_04775 [Clostridia bacterium]|nr:hypothetical protein [Clostridia bacterium]